MSLKGPPVYYFLSLSSVAVLNMKGGAGACLKGKGGEWRGYPEVLVCDSGTSGPQPGLTAEASVQSRGGVHVHYQPYTPACVCPAELIRIFLMCALHVRVFECEVDKLVGFICATHE